MTAEISSIFKATLPLCPSCQAEISEDDSFCQECGSPLSLAEAGEPVRQPVQLKMTRLHPSLGKPVVALPLVGLIVLGLVLITIFLLGFEKSYSGFSNRYVIEQATQSYKENRFDEAATILERLSLSHKLDDEQRTLLSDVYLARSEQRAGRSDYVGAMSDLLKIPPQYSKFILVTGRRNELAELIKVQQAQAQAQALAAAKNHVKSERSKSQLSSKALANSATTATLQAPPAISVTPATETVSSGNHGQAQSTGSEFPASRIESSGRAESQMSHSGSQTLLSGSQTSHSGSQTSLSGSQAAQSEVQPSRLETKPTASNSPAMRSEASVPNGLLKAKASKITENDQVRYNELLAGYFSQEHKQSSGASEPPSLKEWIDIGRPKF